MSVFLILFLFFSLSLSLSLSLLAFSLSLILSLNLTRSGSGPGRVGEPETAAALQPRGHLRGQGEGGAEEARVCFSLSIFRFRAAQLLTYEPYCFLLIIRVQ